MSVEVFVHPQGLCESSQVGKGTRIWAFAHVMKNAVVGEGCNICGGAFIESGAILGDGVTVKNNVLVWDKVTVEDRVFLGPNAVFTNDMNPRAAFKKDPDEFLTTKVRVGSSIGANATIVCGVEIGMMSLTMLWWSAIQPDKLAGCVCAVRNLVEWNSTNNRFPALAVVIMNLVTKN